MVTMRRARPDGLVVSVCGVEYYVPGSVRPDPWGAAALATELELARRAEGPRCSCDRDPDAECPTHGMSRPRSGGLYSPNP